MEDFAPTKVSKSRSKRPLGDITNQVVRPKVERTLKKKVSKTDSVVDDSNEGASCTDRSTQVPAIKTVEKSTQAGWENAVNYAKKTERSEFVTYR